MTTSDDDTHAPMTTHTPTSMISSAVIQPHPASCGGSQSPRHRQTLAETRGQVPLCPTSNEALVGSGCPLELRKTEFNAATVIKAPDPPGSLDRGPPLPVYCREPTHSTSETELPPISKSTEGTGTQAKTCRSTEGLGTQAKTRSLSSVVGPIPVVSVQG